MQDLNSAIKLIKSKDYRDGNGDLQIVFLTADRNRNTGGDLINLDKACHCGIPSSCKGHDMIGIMDMTTGKKYAVHIRLIFQLNKQEIYWV